MKVRTSQLSLRARERQWACKPIDEDVQRVALVSRAAKASRVEGRTSQLLGLCVNTIDKDVLMYYESFSLNAKTAAILLL